MKGKMGMIALMMLLLTVSLAAAVTLVNPATTSVNSGTMMLNVTSCGASADNDTIGNWSVVWEAKSVSTANSSWAVIKNFSNASIQGGFTYNTAFAPGGQGFNTTFNTGLVGGGASALEDASDYQFRATCYNGTSSYDDLGYGPIIGTASAVTTGVIVDNTVPAISGVSVSAGDKLEENSVVSATINVANITNDDAQGIWFGSNYYPLTRSGNTVSFTAGRGRPADGIYEVRFSASDQRNSTETRIANVEVKTYPSGGGVGSGTVTQQQYAELFGIKFTPNMIIVLVVMIFIVMSVSGKGGRKR